MLETTQQSHWLAPYGSNDNSIPQLAASIPISCIILDDDNAQPYPY